jgi:hypothetical protein
MSHANELRIACRPTNQNRNPVSSFRALAIESYNKLQYHFDFAHPLFKRRMMMGLQRYDKLLSGLSC